MSNQSKTKKVKEIKGWAVFYEDTVENDIAGYNRNPCGYMLAIFKEIKSARKYTKNTVVKSKVVEVLISPIKKINKK
jgi:hypothetical protein